ncbi:hypothetical protein J0J33_08415 [Lactococcus sp. LG1267]|uniref:hypothetical protein n=1 Tax=Lactococcus sp. LG1267 TaxID=2816910 RepID=UPI001A8BF7B9|nr:hypothetical protein [Lactococcus sp. LG1267]QSR03766.1 hypothetical protein J0J33_08415 [Lactococcus sp. LG1267]
MVEVLYKSTLKHFPGIPIPDEELAKELLRVGVKARFGAEELTTLKEHLEPYSDKDIVKIHEEKMQLVTATEFKAVHRQMLEQTSDLEKKLATAVKALEDINDCTWHSKNRGLVVDTSDNGTVNLFDFTEKALAEIGGKDD